MSARDSILEERRIAAAEIRASKSLCPGLIQWLHDSILEEAFIRMEMHVALMELGK